MKRIKIGLPAALLALCLLVSSCESTGGGGGSRSSSDGVPKTLVINGISGYTGDILVTVSSTSQPAASMVAVGGARVSGGRVTFPLVIPGREDTRWTGIGDFFIVLVYDETNTIYFYSGGGMSALRYTFSEATTTLSLNEFRRM